MRSLRVPFGKQATIPSFPAYVYSCSPIGRGGCFKNSLCTGSTPVRSTNGMWRNLVARQLWELKVVGSNPAIPTICPCDETGKRAGLRNQILWVQLPPRVLNWVVKPFGHTRKAERICSCLLSRLIQVQPLGDPPNFAPVTQVEEVPNLKFGSCWFKSSQGYW